jgi:DNA-directed RNA polymerase subunit F
MKAVSETPVTLSEVADILSKKEKEYKAEGKEMLYEQKRALEHARNNVKLNPKQARELAGKLSELNSELNAERAVKIVDLMPETVDDVRVIFAKERFKYEEEDIKKILDLVAQYR